VKREDSECCDARSAAERLGIAEDDVEFLIALGELPAVTFMGDPRSFVLIADIEKLAKKYPASDTNTWARAWKNAESRLGLGRLRNAIF
jgi:hypothetical protein